MCIRLSMLWNELLAHLGMDTFRVSYCGRSLYVVRPSVQMFVHNCFWQSKNFFSEPRPNLMHFHRKPHDPLWNTTKRCDSATTIQQPTKWFAFKIFSSETTGSRSIQLDVKLCLMTTKYNKRNNWYTTTTTTTQWLTSCCTIENISEIFVLSVCYWNNNIHTFFKINRCMHSDDYFVWAMRV